MLPNQLIGEQLTEKVRPTHKYQLYDVRSVAVVHWSALLRSQWKRVTLQTSTNHCVVFFYFSHLTQPLAQWIKEQAVIGETPVFVITAPGVFWEKKNASVKFL